MWMSASIFCCNLDCRPAVPFQFSLLLYELFYIMDPLGMFFLDICDDCDTWSSSWLNEWLLNALRCIYNTKLLLVAGIPNWFLYIKIESQSNYQMLILGLLWWVWDTVGGGEFILIPSFMLWESRISHDSESVKCGTESINITLSGPQRWSAPRGEIRMRCVYLRSVSVFRIRPRSRLGKSYICCSA